MTSLNGNGFSLTLLRVADTGLGPGMDMLALLDAPHETTAWPAPLRPATWALAKTAPPAPLAAADAEPTSRLTSAPPPPRPRAPR